LSISVIIRVSGVTTPMLADVTGVARESCL